MSVSFHFRCCTCGKAALELAWKRLPAVSLQLRQTARSGQHSSTFKGCWPPCAATSGSSTPCTCPPSSASRTTKSAFHHPCAETPSCTEVPVSWLTNRVSDLFVLHNLWDLALEAEWLLIAGRHRAPQYALPKCFWGCPETRCLLPGCGMQIPGLLRAVRSS